MIEYVRGILDELTPTQATIECHGVGYILNISLNTYTALQGKGEARLFVYEAIREDAWTLFGFATKQERELFLLLISVSGVGGNTGLFGTCANVLNVEFGSINAILRRIVTKLDLGSVLFDNFAFRIF